MKVCNGSPVLVKAQKVGTLYKLDARILTGSTAKCSLSTADDNTKLWNMRLGLMSKKCLNVLGKRGLLCGHNFRKLDLCEHCLWISKASELQSCISPGYGDFGTFTHIFRGRPIYHQRGEELFAHLY